MLYRVFTEDLNRQQVAAIVNSYYDGFTMYKAQGYWQGTKENSLVIEIVSEAGNAINKIREIANKIKVFNHQQAVLVESLANHSEFV